MCRKCDDVLVDTCDAPNGESTTHTLLKRGATSPALVDHALMPLLPPPTLSLARHSDLNKCVYGCIVNTARNKAEVDAFWQGVIGDLTTPPAEVNAAVYNEGDHVPIPVQPPQPTNTTPAPHGCRNRCGGAAEPREAAARR